MCMADINPSEIIISAIVGVIIAEFWNFIKRKYAKTKSIKKLKNIKIINILWFILAYIFPLITIIFLILNKNTELNFKNIALFIILCISFVYNILMSHINSLYKLNIKLTKINSNKLSKIDKTFSQVYKHIDKTKSDNNLR